MFKKQKLAALAVAASLALPGIASASLLDPSLTIRFQYTPFPGASGDNTATADTSFGFTWQNGDGTELDEYFLEGDSLSVVSSSILRLGTNPTFAWGPMTMTVSGWAADQKLTGVTGGGTGVSAETVADDQWQANLNYAVSTVTDFLFSFETVTPPPGGGGGTGPMAPVPLPAGMVLLLSALGGLVVMRARKS
jgi:hypothetical protein